MALDHDTALEETKSDPEGDRLSEVFDRAMERFDATVLPQQEMRAEALEARRFASIPGAQWEGDWGEQWANSIKVEINKVAAGLEKIERDYRENRIVPDFRPAGDQSDQETADTLDGMHRADSYYFKSQQARDNAFSEASSGGFGAYRLTNELADPLDKDSDAQRINPGLAIVDADQRVFFDGNSKLYDKSDAKFGFVLTAVTRLAFEAEWPGKAVSWPENTLRRYWDWFTPDVVIIAEYYEVEDKEQKLLVFRHILTDEEQRHWASDLDAGELAELEAKGWTKTERRRKRRRVHKYLMNGNEVLADQGFIAGELIPIVPVYGKRWYIDNQERFRGYTQLKMDPQRAYNASVSRLSETNALSPREKPIFAAEQMPPHLRDLWERQEIDRHPYALVNPLLDPISGAIVSAGPIGKIEPPQVAPVEAALLQIANNDLTEDQQDADEVVANTSAEAMDIAAMRIDAKSEIYLDNMRQSVQREGEIYLSMAREIYCEPGRKVETMTEDGDDGEAELQQPYTDKNGTHRIINDFSRGRYKVIADVTEATATKRGKAVKSSLGIASVAVQAGNQDLANVALLTAVMNQDGEGTQAFQKYARRELVQMGVEEPNEEEAREMQEAAQNQQPDATQTALLAQAKELEASAELKREQAKKAAADTGLSEANTALSEAKVIDTLASAEAKGREPANDDVFPRPRIRMGRDL